MWTASCRYTHTPDVWPTSFFRSGERTRVLRRRWVCTVAQIYTVRATSLLQNMHLFAGFLAGVPLLETDTLLTLACMDR